MSIPPSPNEAPRDLFPIVSQGIMDSLQVGRLTQLPPQIFVLTQDSETGMRFSMDADVEYRDGECFIKPTTPSVMRMAMGGALREERDLVRLADLQLTKTDIGVVHEDATIDFTIDWLSRDQPDTALVCDEATTSELLRTISYESGGPHHKIVRRNDRSINVYSTYF